MTEEELQNHVDAKTMACMMHHSTEYQAKVFLCLGFLGFSA
jgi:hypothetical protein